MTFREESKLIYRVLGAFVVGDGVMVSVLILLNNNSKRKKATKEYEVWR